MKKLSHDKPEDFTSAVQPRGMTKRDAAAYCGCESLAAFDDWVRREIVPRPIPGTHRWDRKAIDIKLDLASGLQSRTEPATALEEWRAKKNARASQRREEGHREARDRRN
jgi:hypothetical protein